MVLTLIVPSQIPYPNRSCRLTESPDNQTLKETLAQIERTIAGGSTPAPSAGAAPPSASSSTPRAASGGSGRTVMWNGLPVPERKLDRGVRGARLAVLLLLIVFLLPTGVLSGRAYMLMLVLAAGAHGAAMVARHGLPAGRDIATAAAYLSALGEHESLHLLFLPLLFATQSPNIVAALVSVDFHVLDAAQWLHTAAAAKAPAVAGALARAGALIAPYIAQRPPAELARLSPSAHRTAVIGGLVHHNAYAELMLLVLSVLRLLTPARSIVATLALWQVLQLRFSTSAATRDACGALDAAVSKLAFHPACPAPIGNGYTWLRGFLRSRVRSPEDMQTEAQARRAAGPGGGAPSCSIM